MHHVPSRWVPPLSAARPDLDLPRRGSSGAWIPRARLSRTSRAPPARVPAHAPLTGWVAGALVFGSSAAVLVVEVVALRLLAPYLGLTLETSTLVIGIALTAIAVGSWAGGRAADTVAPRRTLAPLLAVSGAVVALTRLRRSRRRRGSHHRPRAAGGRARDLRGRRRALGRHSDGHRAQLTSLGETGAVVGRLSGVGTAARSRAPCSPASSSSHGCPSAASSSASAGSWSSQRSRSRCCCTDVAPAWSRQSSC